VLEGDVDEGWAEVGFGDRGWPTGVGYSGVEGLVQLRRLFAYSGGVDGGEVFVSGVLGGEAVFYLNGVEVGRGSGDGEFALRLSGDGLVLGVNVLAVELRGSRFASGGVVGEVGGERADVVGHVAGEVVINEMCYHPAPTYADRVNGVEFAEDGLEWIELHNRSGVVVDLSGWRLRGGIGYDFPEGSELEAGGYLVVDGTAFSGSLGDGGDVVRLRRSGGALVDEVEYFDSGRWPEVADGGGSTLELSDPDGDNRKAEAWVASDESGLSEWVEYRYRASGAEPRGSNNPDSWREFLFGFLDAGEALVDDVSVVESPDGAARELIVNGTFEGDVAGGPAARWRLLGTHRESRVVVNPDGVGKVLKMVATGGQTHTYNTVSTTLAGNRAVSSRRTYEISFRAKWISGSPQLNSRLYLNRAARVNVLRQPGGAGTPGAANRGAVANAGPTFDRLAHFPLVPGAGDAVQVSVVGGDPDGVAAAKVFYSVDGGAWESVVMGGDSDGRYLGILPAQANGSVVQFYVEATDGGGAVSRFPDGGEDSRALFRVGDGGVSGQRPRNKMRLLMLGDEANAMHTERDAVSNYRRGGTVIYNDETVYYDVGVRLRGAPFGRRGRPGWNIRFGDDRPFRGAHASVVIDGALNMPKGDGTGWITTTSGVSVNEMLFNVVGNRAGGVGATYDDIVYFEAPRARDNRLAQLKMMRFEPGYLEEFVGDGGAGNF
ncbi:MAG: lamin tail domain-containing protein, partial [Verrucomicrobiales bacterium]|nr:lamin tail domain-containing protein [Verrucomicrobiales bacterium]